MAEMTTRERVARMFGHHEADRIPVTDSPWGATIERWQREGMPAGADYRSYFGLDQFQTVMVDNSPRYPATTVEETEEHIVQTTPWGVTMRNFKHSATTPEFLHHTVVSPDAWREARERIQPSRDRINWENLERNYRTWREDGSWIDVLLWFGFDVTHSWMVGTDRMLEALATDPEWCMDMFGHMLEVNIALLDMVWDEGYRFDGAVWFDDMGYKHAQFFSLGMYRDLLKPYHQRAIDWAHSKGLKAKLHSCGDVNPFVPELVEMGLDALNPLEVKAGMDPIALKKQFGDRLVFHGGINAVLYNRPDEIRCEMERVIPSMKEQGGYIFASDHSVPSTVSLEDFRQIVDLAKRLGSY
jgi:uroporphyrinogen decarboxylase